MNWNCLSSVNGVSSSFQHHCPHQNLSDRSPAPLVFRLLIFLLKPCLLIFSLPYFFVSLLCVSFLWVPDGGLVMLGVTLFTDSEKGDAVGSDPEGNSPLSSA